MQEIQLESQSWYAKASAVVEAAKLGEAVFGVASVWALVRFASFFCLGVFVLFFWFGAGFFCFLCFLCFFLVFFGLVLVSVCFVI